MTKSSLAAALLVCLSTAAVACAQPAEPAESLGTTTSHETGGCSEVYEGRGTLGNMSLSAAGAHTNAFAITVDPSTTSRIQLTFHVESIAGSPWSEFTVRITDEQGRQLGDMVASGGGLRVVPLLTSAYPSTHVFYAQVTLTNPTGGVAEQVSLAKDVWARQGCEVAPQTETCNCDGWDVNGNPVHSDVCGSSVCGGDHKFWVCTTGNYQPSSDQNDCN
jgi:hypothetical protein